MLFPKSREGWHASAAREDTPHVRVADRDTSRAAAHKTAAQRRAVLLEAELARQFPDGDPLADELRAALTTAGQGSGDTVASVLASRAALPLPILMVRGLNAAAAPSRSGRRCDKVRQNLSAIQNREFCARSTVS